VTIDAAGGTVTWLRGEPVEKPKAMKRKPAPRRAELDDDADVETVESAGAPLDETEPDAGLESEKEAE
jgi:hypothetical protein